MKMKTMFAAIGLVVAAFGASSAAQAHDNRWDRHDRRWHDDRRDDRRWHREREWREHRYYRVRCWTEWHHRKPYRVCR